MLVSKFKEILALNWITSSSIFVIDCVASKREPSVGWSRSTAEMLQGSGSNLWEMYEAERYEWSTCYENALHQLHLPEMCYVPKRARR